MFKHPFGTACLLCDGVLVDQLAGRLAQQEPEAIEKLQRELPNGARVVSWLFDMGEWQPSIKRSEHGGTIYCWHVNRPGP